MLVITCFAKPKGKRKVVKNFYIQTRLFLHFLTPKFARRILSESTGVPHNIRGFLAFDFKFTGFFFKKTR